MGYPPPCQPPLVAAGSSSPLHSEKRLGSLTSCFQDAFFPAAGFLVAHHRSDLLPGWSRFLLPEGCVPLNRLLNPPISPRRFFWFSTVARFSSELEFGFDCWRSVSTRSSVSGWRGFRPWCPFPGLSPEGFILGSVSPKPFVVAEVVPKNCYCYSSRRCTVVGTTATRLQPSLSHASKWLHGRSLPKLRFFL